MVRALFPGITNDVVPGLSAAKVSNAERRRLKVCRFSSVSISLDASALDRMRGLRSSRDVHTYRGGSHSALSSQA